MFICITQYQIEYIDKFNVLYQSAYTKKPPSHTHIYTCILYSHIYICPYSYIYVRFQTSENTRKPLFVIIQIKIYYEFYVCTMCKSYDGNLHIMCSHSTSYIHWLNFGSLTYANSYIVGIGFFYTKSTFYEFLRCFKT